MKSSAVGGNLWLHSDASPSSHQNYEQKQQYISFSSLLVKKLFFFLTLLQFVWSSFMISDLHRRVSEVNLFSLLVFSALLSFYSDVLIFQQQQKCCLFNQNTMFYDTITNISINIYWCGSLRFSDFGSMTIIHLFCFKKYILTIFTWRKT